MFDHYPTRLALELSTQCNSACIQCNRYLDDDPVLGIVENPAVPQTTMTLSDIKKLLPSDYLTKVKYIKLTGSHGDPTMAKDAIPIMSWIKQQNPNILFQMDSNGGTRTVTWWRDAAKFFSVDTHPYNFLTFSIDGLEDTNHIYRRRVVWKKVMRNARAFIDAGGIACWAFLVFEHNKHQVTEARNLAKKMGFTYFQVKVSSREAIRPVQWLTPPKSWKVVQPRGKGDIQCLQLPRDEIMITAQGYFLPCPYIAEAAYGPTRPDDATEEIHEVLGDFQQYHGTNGLDKILPLYKKVSDRWATNPMRVCSTECDGTNLHRLQQYLKIERLKDV